MSFLCLFLLLNYSAYSTIDDINNLPVHVLISQSYQKYSYKIIPSASNTFGYEIYSGDKLIIRQLTIPGMPGNTGFQRKGDAGKIAKLVISKLSKGIMPPSIGKKEMDQIHIKF